MSARILSLACGLLCLAISANISAEEKKPDSMVMVEARFLEVPSARFRKLLAEVTETPEPLNVQTLTPDQLSRFADKLNQGGDLQVLASPKVVTNLGQPASIQIGKEVEVDLPQKKMEFVGLSINILVKADGELLKLDVQTSNRQQVANVAPPAFQEKRIDTQLKVFPNQAAMIGGITSRDGHESVTLILVQRI